MSILIFIFTLRRKMFLLGASPIFIPFFFNKKIIKNVSEKLTYLKKLKMKWKICAALRVLSTIFFTILPCTSVIFDVLTRINYEERFL